MKLFHKNVSIGYYIFLAFLCANIMFTGYAGYSMYNFFNKFNTEIEQNIQYNNQLLEKINKDTELMKNSQMTKDEKNKIRLQSIYNMKSEGFDSNTDLAGNNKLTAEDMNQIINIWDKKIDNGTRFKGKGEVFMEAAEETGLNPIYILAHAAVESNWGNSVIAREKNNFFGINCVDTNPSKGYYMGDDIDSGIISGAKWIKANFYSKGYKNLYSMKKANYATDPRWESTIINIANESIKLL